MPTMVKCQVCGKEFKKYKQQRFCSCSCSAKWRMSQPEIKAKVYTEKMREKSRQSMKKLWANPDTRAKIYAHLYSSNNPALDQKNKDKAVIANREKTGFKMLTGGNGHGPTKAQAALADAIGWPMEVVVKTGYSKYYPTVYKVDVGNSDLKIAIEVDGHSHRTAKGEATDTKKTRLLVSMGWVVLRFKNEDVLNDLPHCVETVRKSIDMRRRNAE